MNMISSTSAPYLLYAEQSGKPRETYGNRFSDALEEEKAKNNIAVSAPEIAVNEMNRVRTEQPSYTVTEEEAEYFREKYGKEYDEEKPYQLFYELSEKNIISHDDAVSSSGYGHIILVYGPVHSGCNIKHLLEQGLAKESYSNKHGWCNSYYDRFMGSYDKEITTWLDVSQREYDFWQYLIDLDERLVTPDGTYFQSSKEQMNVDFRRECESILKVKDVLSQIFG